MDTLQFDLANRAGKFKPMNATNGAPMCSRHTTKMSLSNFDAYKEARMPYCRNHDANLSGSTYGGPYTVDISAIFPDFSADVNDPASYDFSNTDATTLVTFDAGSEVFYRLGQSIENQIGKRNIFPPKDFKKWAQICEHIIRHYNEGWDNGYTLNIQYWEIWNEPDLDPEDCPPEKKRTWGGTKEQFFDFYELSAKYLKACFPHLKIGGPALAFREEWAEEFMTEMEKRQAPLDFFSWHAYRTIPEGFAQRGEYMRERLDAHGFTKTESILNEWNYVRGWSGDDYRYTVETIGNIKGAAFIMACMTAAQASPIDMMMYYDTRPSKFDGAFDYYTNQPRKPYYALKLFGMFYDMDAYVPAGTQVDNLYTLCGVDKDNKAQVAITYYTDEDGRKAKTFSIDLGKTANYEVYLLDNDHDLTLVDTTAKLTFTMQPNTCLLIKEI